MNKQGVVSVRFNPDDLATIQAAATARDMTISAYLREIALRAELESRPDIRIVHTDNGAPIVLWTNAPHLLVV